MKIDPISSRLDRGPDRYCSGNGDYEAIVVGILLGGPSQDPGPYRAIDDVVLQIE